MIFWMVINRIGSNKNLTIFKSQIGEKLLKIPTYGGWTTRCWIIQQHFWWDSKADLSPVEHRRPHWGTMSQWRLEISLICSWPGGCADNEYLNIGSSLERDEQGIFRGCHRGYKESKATHLSFLHLFETIYNFFYICISYNESQKRDMQRDVQTGMPKMSNNGD